MISIIIPVYNDEKYIIECLKSIKNQTYKDFECLCMDDGSNDNTINLINQFINTDDRFNLYIEEHKGPGWQRNNGIKKSKGEYIAFMDHDDFVEPEWLQSLYETLIQNNVDISYCSNSDYYENTKENVNYFFPDYLTGTLYFNDNDRIPKDLLCSYFAPWRRLLKRDLIVSNNIHFAEGNFKFDDVLFTQLLMINVKSVAFCNKVLYHHRIFDNSITGNSFINKDVYFEHFETANEVIKYANENNKDYKKMIINMLPLFVSYLFYVDSKKEYFKKLKELIYTNKLSLKYKIQLFICFCKLKKAELKEKLKF